MNYKSIYNDFHSYLVDLLRFLRTSHMHNPAHTQLSAKAHVYRVAHTLEKGMALPIPRKGFGRTKIEELIDFTTQYCQRWSVDHDVSVAIFTMAKLLSFHSKRGQKMQDLEIKIQQIRQRYPGLSKFENKFKIGNQSLTRNEIIEAAPRDSDAFFYKTL